jgi:hypothetical protein
MVTSGRYAREPDGPAFPAGQERALP